MAEITANGIRFHVQRLTSKSSNGAIGGTVVFVHGLIADDLSSFFYTLANPAAKAGADVVLYDMRGHGKSERTPTGYTVADSVADLRALLAALDVEGPVHLVGNSYGGTVALRFALSHPESVASLTLIEAHLPLAGWGDLMRESLHGAISGFHDPDRLRDIENAPLRYRHHLWRLRTRTLDFLDTTSVIADLAATPPMTGEDLRGITCPALLVYGTESDVLDHGEVLAAHLPNRTYEVLPDLHHRVLLEGTVPVRELFLGWMTRQTAEAMVEA
jgi:pimeloyl-ACP methyl ester carboxylesterase